MFRFLSNNCSRTYLAVVVVKFVETFIDTTLGDQAYYAAAAANYSGAYALPGVPLLPVYSPHHLAAGQPHHLANADVTLAVADVTLLGVVCELSTRQVCIPESHSNFVSFLYGKQRMPKEP